MKQFLLSIRTILRFKTYTAINVAGLALSLSCVFILVRYIHQEYTVNHFVPHLERTFMTYLVDGVNTPRLSTSEDYNNDPNYRDPLNDPSVEMVSRFIFINDDYVIKDGYRYTVNTLVADSLFFEMMPYPCVEGVMKLAPNEALISAEAAGRLFGEENPVGKELTVSSGKYVKVVGVFGKPATKSFVQFDVVLSMDLLPMWGYLPYEVVRLHRADDVTALNRKNAVPMKLQAYNGRPIYYRLVPLDDVYLGRGLAKIRPTNYAQYELLKDRGNDIRYNENNWFDKSRITYNRPKSKGGSEKYFGKPVDPKYCTDTMRCYFSFPIVKVLIDKDDPNKGGKVPIGGYTDQYIFRLAETYLNRAEARWWQGNIKGATEDVNEIRNRAKATPLPESSATLEDILDERARELFLEDHRKTELTRIAFLKAKLGIDGYSLDNFSEKNWYYDRVMEKNNFFKDKYFYSTNAFIMEPYHVLWPIPQNAIESNTQGRINQNYGYDGYEDNIPVDELDKR